MLHFSLRKNNTGAEFIETDLSGKSLLEASKLNKDCAFTQEERIAFNLLGKLPQSVETLDEQAARYYQQYQQKDTALEKNIYLAAVHDHNETLFYKLIKDHLVEMLPIVYTPTVGDAVEKFSHQLRRMRGLYLAYPDRDHMEEMLDNRLNPEVDLIVVTDGEGVLGIGDQGIGGMDISIAKLMVYTLCGGINPHRVLPIQLDVGTNNQALLDDPMYLGWRHPRITGQEYDDFIDNFVQTVRKKFPNIYLHWEDFGRDNARRNLERYRDKMCTFNDDMQGTGATALACILSALTATSAKLADQRIVVFGAGTAGVGIVDQIYRGMRADGMSEEDARSRFWLIDRAGLLIADMPGLMPFQLPYARKRSELANWTLTNSTMISLYDVIKNTKATVLIGCSTVFGAFNEVIVKTMAENLERPIIMPLSNPTTKSEATPQELYDWTDGKALIAAGSPFEPINFKGQKIPVAQSNNAYIFPGLGLGIIAAKATRCTDGMLSAACHALSACSPVRKDKNAPILPPLTQAFDVSRQIALAVAQQARKEGVAQIAANADLEIAINNLQWEPKYYPYQKVAAQKSGNKFLAQLLLFFKKWLKSPIDV